MLKRSLHFPSELYIPEKHQARYCKLVLLSRTSRVLSQDNENKNLPSPPPTTANPIQHYFQVVRSQSLGAVKSTIVAMRRIAQSAVLLLYGEEVNMNRL